MLKWANNNIIIALEWKAPYATRNLTIFYGRINALDFAFF